MKWYSVTTNNTHEEELTLLTGRLRDQNSYYEAIPVAYYLSKQTAYVSA